jgi:hypothetical protein
VHDVQSGIQEQREVLFIHLHFLSHCNEHLID